MRTLRTLLLGTCLALAAALSACGGDGAENHFVGTWLVEDGRAITFEGDTWSDSDGDAGDYAYEGEYPEFEVTFELPGRSFTRRALFLDRDTMDLCLAFASGAVQDCVRLVKDRPIIPG